MTTTLMSMEQELEKRIERTGGMLVLDDLMYSHLTLTAEEYEQYKDGLSGLAERLNLDFISVERKGPVEFQHVTTIETAELIEKNGFKVVDEDFVGDLGKGFYGYQEENLYGFVNVKNYISEDFWADEVAVITAEHEGRYLECVYGYGHVGYLLICADHIPAENIVNIEEYSVEEYLFL